jgi:hypothetical protein
MTTSDAPKTTPAASPPLITPKGLKAALWQTCFHACLSGGGSILNKECLDFPGLVVSSSWSRKAGNSRTFYVAGDKREFSTIQDAAKAWNDRKRAEAAASPAEAA